MVILAYMSIITLREVRCTRQFNRDRADPSTLHVLVYSVLNLYFRWCIVHIEYGSSQDPCKPGYDMNLQVAKVKEYLEFTQKADLSNIGTSDISFSFVN